MLKIFLADLVYNTVKTNNTVPLNIAYLGAYIEKKYKDQVSIKLFKYPEVLEEALKESPPDILGTSHYSWNTNLSKFFLRKAKEINPKIMTVMGGPHIRLQPQELEKFLRENTYLDYYIMFEGEEPFLFLVEQALDSNLRPIPAKGIGSVVDDKFYFEALSLKGKPRILETPSPYLSGMLDEFIKDESLIPLFETNRGCPFGCTYCAWGVAALSKVRQRPLEVVFAEIDYVAENSSGQVNWIFCDANFGMLPRDVEIAKKIKSVCTEKGFPLSVTLWHAKNSGKRNVEIAKIMDEKGGYIAIQSTDPEVLKLSGRGNIHMKELKESIAYYRENNMSVSTDILIGLPGETKESHLRTLREAFDMGFGEIMPINIRLLPGTDYEKEDSRKECQIITKFRPIFGAYGTFFGENVFEMEQSLRATKDMNEDELNSFKVLHWLIYLCWNCGLFKPMLRFAQKHDVNPAEMLYQLTLTKDLDLSELFKSMRKKSLNEWFETEEEMASFYNQPKNYSELKNNFVKLNFLYIAIVYSNEKLLAKIESELMNILVNYLSQKSESILNQLEQIREFTNTYVCKDLLQSEFSEVNTFDFNIASLIVDESQLPTNEKVEIEVYRPKESVNFCNFHLADDENIKLMTHLTKFFEIGGMRMLTNSVRIADLNKTYANNPGSINHL